MTLLPFLAVAFAAGSLSLLTRRAARASAAVGLAGLVLAGLAAGTIRDEAPFRIAGGAIAGTEFARLFLGLGAWVGLLLCVVALATSWPRSLPGAMLVGLGATGLAIGVTDAATAVAAATGGAVAGILVTAVGAASERGLLVASRELRALVVAGALALGAVAVVAGPLGGVRVDPQILGVAYLSLVAAVAIRLGAIPFHLWAARVADAAPEIGLPLVMAWGPAAFAIVALGWIDGTLIPLGEDLGPERGLVALIGLASLAMGTAAAIAHDDLEHVVGYSIVADAGVALLGLAVLDPIGWEATRTWLVCFVVVKSAFAAWVAALRGAYGTRRLSELGGWARGSPLLALGLVVIGVAAIGWPGLAAFASRGFLIVQVFDGPLGLFAVAAVLASILVYARVLAVGVGRRSRAVEGGPGLRFRWPARRADLVSRAMIDDVVEAWGANRASIAAITVLALAGLAAAVSGGGLGVQQAAAGLPPTLGEPTESFGP